MPVGVSAYTALANLTLSSSASVVTFTSISSSFRDLVLIININGVTGTVTNFNSSMRLNTDSGSNYNDVTMGGNGSSALSDTGSNQTYIVVPTSETSVPSITKIDFLDYSATDKHKSLLVRGNLTVSQVSARAVRWANTSAISTITLFGPDYLGGTPDTWNAGSTFALYGVSA
jgi:hypothetical protein